MIIQTKFNVGDKVYVLHEHKVKEVRVARITIRDLEITKSGIKGIYYYFEEENNNCLSYHLSCCNENKVFASREELANALGL